MDVIDPWAQEEGQPVAQHGDGEALSDRVGIGKRESMVAEILTTYPGQRGKKEEKEARQ